MTGRLTGVVAEISNPSRGEFLGMSLWTDRPVSGSTILSRPLSDILIVWGLRSRDIIVSGIYVHLASSRRDPALTARLSRDTVLTGGFGGTRGFSLKISFLWSVCALLVGVSFQETVLLVFFFSLKAFSATFWRWTFKFPSLSSFVRWEAVYPRRDRGPLLRCILSSLSLSELIVLSELIAGVLRLILKSVPALPSLAVLFSYVLAVALLRFSLFESFLELFVWSGDWERDEDGEVDVSGWTIGVLEPVKTQNTCNTARCFYKNVIGSQQLKERTT